MFALAASLFDRLTAYFKDEEVPSVANDEPGQIRSEEDTTTSPSDTYPNQHFPRNLTDIHQTLKYLTHASTPALPTELLKLILYHADYDCLHFTASSNRGMSAISRNQLGPPPRAYIETPPLNSIASTSTFDESATPVGRIRSLQINITGRDQGWTSDPETASWSWFEIGKKRFGSDVVQRGPVLAHNAVARRDWEDHELYYHIDEEVRQIGVGEELKQWIGELRVDDRVVIVPMSKYGGWQCRVSKASIDIEVEVWY